MAADFFFYLFFCQREAAACQGRWRVFIFNYVTQSLLPHLPLLPLLFFYLHLFLPPSSVPNSFSWSDAMMQKASTSFSFLLLLSLIFLFCPPLSSPPSPFRLSFLFSPPLPYSFPPHPLPLVLSPTPYCSSFSSSSYLSFFSSSPTLMPPQNIYPTINSRQGEGERDGVKGGGD